MSKTISDLLESVHLNHKIPNGHPFLATKLSSIEKNLHPEVLLFVWLFTENLVDLELFYKPDTSSDLSQKFASSSLNEMTTLYAELYVETEQVLKSKSKSKTLNLQPILKQYPSINACQVTYWLSQFTTYITLMNALNQSPISKPLVPVKKAVQFSSIPQINEFTSHATEKKNFFKKNYANLGGILIHLGVTLPDDLSPELNYLLEIDFEDIGSDLSNNVITELTAYVLLFLFNRAEFDIDVVNYTYADERFKTSLSKAISEIADKLCDNLYKEDKLSFRQLKEYINYELSGRGLRAQPNQFMIFCFDNCPLLQILMLKYWNAQGLKLSMNNPCALAPHLNPFVLGRRFHSAITNKAVLADNQDLPLLFVLMDLTQSISKKTPDFFSETTESIKEQFEETRTLIVNPIIFNLFSFEQMHNYQVITLINDAFVCKFIKNYINPDIPQTPHQIMQDNFLEIFNDHSEKIIERFIDELMDSVDRSDPDYINHMYAQEKKAKKNAARLDATLVTATATKQETNWFNAQDKILNRIQTAYANAINEAISAPQEDNHPGF